MKPQPRRRTSLATALAAATLGAATALADPDWWGAGTVIDTGEDADDYAPANQGQLKNIIDAADDELDTEVGADWTGSVEGKRVEAVIDGWPSTGANDYLPVNQGQVKNAAVSFRRWLGLDVPWGSDYGTANDYAPANQGQVKNAFSFGLDDGATGDLDADGLTNAEEQALGTNPRSSDSDRDGVPDAADDFPLDPGESSIGEDNPSDTTGPVVTLLQPTPL